MNGSAVSRENDQPDLVVGAPGYYYGGGVYFLFLASDAARFISGVNLFADHGYLAQVETGQRPGLL